MIDSAGDRHISAYVACNGNNEIILASQDQDDLTVRPFGDGTSYPPHFNNTPPPQGYTILAKTSKGVLNATVTTDQTVLSFGEDSSPYYRFAGRIRGGFQGGDVLEGVALYEQWSLIP